MAGSKQGLDGARSGLLYPLLDILTALQAVHPSPVGYLLENVVPKYNFNSARVRNVDAPRIAQLLGPEVVVDAARHGSYAHRVRAYWTNLAAPHHLQAVLDAHERPDGALVEHVLEPGRYTRPVEHPDLPPRYRCNEVDSPMRALPTLMAYTGSYNIRAGRPGDILNENGTSSPPSPEERERILGYPTGATAAPCLTAKQRSEVTGRCMDAFCLQALWASMRVMAGHTGPALPDVAGVCLVTQLGGVPSGPAPQHLRTRKSLPPGWPCHQGWSWKPNCNGWSCLTAALLATSGRTHRCSISCAAAAYLPP